MDWNKFSDSMYESVKLFFIVTTISCVANEINTGQSYYTLMRFLGWLIAALIMALWNNKSK